MTKPKLYRDFKLIAIKPTADCDPFFLRVLTADILYPLCRDFVIEEDQIQYSPSYPEDLFAVNDISVNISAIAGKNGSGKSSLFEMIYAGLYNLAVKEEILIPQKLKLYGDSSGPDHVSFDLFYKADRVIFKLEFRDKNIHYYTYGATDQNYSAYKLLKDTPQEFKDITLFFTIAVNYSFYALNTLDTGPWLRSLFHKNDGYQTPIVINPYRTEGNININRERELVHSRLLFALLQPVTRTPLESLRHLAPGKIAKELVLIIDRSKLKDFKIPKYNSTTSDFLFRYRLADVFEKFLGNRRFRPKDNLYNFYSQLYIIRKLISITQTYDLYKRFSPSVKKVFWTKTKKDREEFFREYLDELKGDHSHVTFKLRRAIHSLEYEFYPKNKEDQAVPIEKLSQLTAAYSDNRNIPILELLPPPFLSIDIVFDQGTFDLLSSGEKQKIYSTYSVIYHLINLNSVKKPLRQYHHISFILDEIELYYHPEMQRTYVYDLLSTLQKADIENIHSVNFCFITHSPFILSDIPKNNILYLKVNENGKALPEDIEQDTFGANIYDLLSHSFYFESGFIGEQSKIIIQQVIDNLQESVPKGTRKLKEREIKQIISLVGEPFLKERLFSMYERKYNDKEPRQQEIQILKDRIKRLEGKA